MRIFSKQPVRKWIASLLLLIIAESAFHPAVSYALTTGPHQPEFISYEAPGSTDMVNLSTGDFTFSLPVLDVPGPEGSFSLPLTYNAGIGTDQESSWVGLGWTMNAGAITRTINGFPDDANGQSQTVTVQDLDGVRGWTANTLFFGSFGWNNQVGHFGSLSVLGIINASWTENFTSVGLIGVNVTSDGVKADPVQMGIGIASVISFGAAGYAAQTGTIVMGAVAKSAAQQLIIGAAISLSASLAEGGVKNPTAGYWKYNERNLKLGVFKKYRIWLDKTRTEDMYGALYLGNAPTELYTQSGNVSIALKNGNVSENLYRFKKSTDTSNKGAASDINYEPDVNEETKQFSEVNNPVMLAIDHFSVKAAGVSGSIEPYRMDIGAVSMPREMSAAHERLATLPYLNDQQYKVAFQYRGSPSNSYYHHVGGASSVTSPSAGNFGISATYASNTLTYNLNDVTFKNERIKSSLNTIKRVPQSNYVEWLSNDDIKNAITYSSKYMDFLSGGTSVNSGSDRYLFRNTIPIGRMSIYSGSTNFGHTIPVNSQDISKIIQNTNVDLYISFYDDASERENGTTSNYVLWKDIHVDVVSSSGFTTNDTRLDAFIGKNADIEISLPYQASQSGKSIGGFCITEANGTTYHFGLPTYDFDYSSEVREIANPTTKRSVIKRSAPFANTWLLTGITGPDFIDRNSNGIIDEADWGYWVKFNYARHQNEYQWRLPYGSGVYRKAPSNTHESYVEGKKQLYYLNTIETRSSVALFVKIDRMDSKSASTITSQYPLALDEIILIPREKYKKITTPTSQGGYGVTDFSNSIGSVLNTTAISSAYDYLKRNCLKRVKFKYSYNLAPGTINSSDPTTHGKLTLEKVSILGRSDLPIIPDYKFEYGFNPGYDANKWDGWGSYSSSGTTNPSSHEASETVVDVSAWSMTKIITPMGSEIQVLYEPDTYSSISGKKVLGTSLSFDNQNFKLLYPSQLPIRKLYINHNGLFSSGEIVRVSGYVNYTCGSSTQQKSSTFNGDFTILGTGVENVNYNGTMISTQYLDLGSDYMNIGTCNLTNSGDAIQFSSQSGSVQKILPNKKGGGLRVNTIIRHDNFGTDNKLRYTYNNDDGTSSGVVSSIPDYINPGISTLAGYPQTPVIYGQVAVLTGKLATVNDYDIRQVYAFQTPHLNQYVLTRNATNLTLGNDQLSVFENKFEDKTSVIGRLTSVTTYDNSGQTFSSVLTYASPDQVLNDGVNNYQGVYTTGAIMFDKVGVNPLIGTNAHKANKTTVVSYPSILQKVVNTKDNMTSESTNLSWDFLTGAVLTKLDKTSAGLYVKSVVKPAYTVYPEMGSKSEDVTRKNMLTQTAATYSYLSNSNAANVGLLSTSLTSWKKDWANYRIYNTGTQTYSDGPESDNVWRINNSWIYKGNYSSLRSDGSLTFAPANEFSFVANATNTGWILSGSTDRYDHYGMPLQSKDINNIYSSTKMGYDNRAPIAQASNANYHEIAFSSAEDPITGIPFFGGEVGIGSGTVKFKSKGQVAETHTGDAVVSVTSGSSFIYKPMASGITLNRTYRASVWTNTTDGRIYYKLNGGVEQLSAAPTIEKKAGNWYQLNVSIPVGGTLSSLEVGVKTVGAAVLFDDFRFQPSDAVMSCFVNNPLDFEYTSAGQPTYQYVLDNENLFTQMEYNERGELVKTYRETFKYGVKLVSENKSNYRRFHTNQ